jgi:RNA polymerase sigma-70 factor (ECF subfamily)
LPAGDLDLVNQARQGDAGAFHALVDRHAKALFGLAYTLLGNTADAEDVLQETLLGAYKQIAQFEGRSSVKTWLTKILVRQVSKVYRSRRVRRAESLADAEQQNAEPAAPRTGSVNVDRQVDVHAMLKTLSEEHREVLVLRELQGLSYDEIADALAIPQGTVESRLHRARQQLKQRFAGYMTDE